MVHFDSVSLISLQTFEQEKTRFNHDWFFLAGYFVPAVIYFSNQLLHVVAVEWGEAHQHLKEHTAKGPSVY